MLEIYSFTAMFVVQILILSILHPARLTRSIRAEVARYPADRVPQLLPNNIGGKLVLYRWLNRIIALVGLAVLVALFRYMQRPDWDDGPVEAVLAVYAGLQVLPLCVASFYGAHIHKLLRNALPTEKRKATLQRRGLFDFVSPLAVFLWLLCYALFVALVMYISQDPFSGFAGPVVNIGLVTVLYAVTGFAVYSSLYGKKSNPLQTNEDRLRQIETVVKILIYSGIAGVVGLSLNFTLVLLDLQRFEPLGHSLFFVIFASLFFMGPNSPPRRGSELSGPGQITGAGTSGVQRV